VASAAYRPPFPLDLWLTLAPLRHGPLDPTHRLERGAAWRATRTGEGPATLHLELHRHGVVATAWGPGADAALDGLPALLGAHDRPEALVVQSSRLRALARRLAGLRLTRTGAVVEALVPAIIEQRVTAGAAHRAWASLVRRFGERAPGPGGLCLPPTPARLADVMPAWLHPLGIEARRAIVIRRVGERASALEACVGLSGESARARLESIPGIGPWTAAETVRSALGDADAVSVGDAHLPRLVCWALAGETRGTDERMLELLAPYRGQRGRLVRLLESSGIRAPRFGPRLAAPDIRAL
jgi:3-methyladenine DNA glycosylase/8-oxoguanine DNA glycosylase